MAFFSSNNVYDAIKTMFANEFFERNINNVSLIKTDYTFLYKLISPKDNISEQFRWQIAFNHFVPDIDYESTIIVSRNGKYYLHNAEYQDDLNTTHRALYKNIVISVPVDENNPNNTIDISFGRKYNYYYL